jgi:PAS domain S-box-containing protein
MITQSQYNKQQYTEYLVGILLLIGFYLSSTYNYLLFHSLIELSSIIVAFGVFLLAWNSRHFVENNYYQLLGIGYLFVAGLDLLHTLAYKGMGVLDGDNPNLATQLWISARYFESIMLLVTPAIAFRAKKIDLQDFFARYLGIVILILLAIFWLEIFPACYIEGHGLTRFKVISEYLISAILGATLLYLYHHRSNFEPHMLRWLMLSILFTIAAEMCFTLYKDVYGLMNLLGHYCKLVSFYLIYKAVIQTTLLHPYQNLFRSMTDEIEQRKQAEKALQEREQTLSAILNTSTDSIIMMERNGTCVMINSTGAARLGMSVDRIQRRCIYELLPPVVAARRKAFVEEILVTKTPMTVEDERAGIWFESKMYPIINEHELVTHLVIVARDITERKLAEEQLRQTTEQLSMLLANLPIVPFTCEATGDFQVLYINQTVKTVTGYAPECFLETPSFWADHIHPDDKPSVLENIPQLFEKGTYEHEYRWQTADGSYKWFLDNLRLVTRPDGSPYLVGSWHDITKRKQMEEALRENEARLADAQRIAHLGHWERNLMTNELQWSDETFRLFGLSPEQTHLTFDTFINAIYPSDRENVQQAIAQAIKHTYRPEFRIVRADGAVRYIQALGKMIRDAAGKPRRFLGTMQDITEYKQAQLKLQQALQAAEIANQAKNVFLANVSHELRTPLNAILGFTQIFQQDNTLTTEQQEGIKIIHRNGEYLLTLIRDILDISKLEAGKLELYPTEFHLGRFLKEISDLFEMRAKHIAFEYQQLSQLPSLIRADEKRLRQIFINLLSNAVKFTQQGSVTFKVAVVERKRRKAQQDAEDSLGFVPYSKIRFQVEDTGTGIAADELDKIFLPFQQSGDLNDKAKGTGLGLSITQKLVKMMGGEIHVESVLGQGTTFWVELDLPELSNETLPVAEESAIIGFEGPPRKILVVDDNRENGLVLVNLLKPLGFELREAYSSQECLETVREWQPDLILIDLVMPQIEGLETSRRFKQIATLKPVVIIGVSASAFEPHKRLEAGCDDFIAKPVHAKALLECLQKHLNLTYVYLNKTNNATSGEKTAPQKEAPIKGPSTEQAAQLYHLTLRGDINGIVNYVKQLEQMDKQLGPFAQKIYPLAEQFAIKQIRQIAKDYMDN